MTREHKLALVIGFGLILFVGILLPDPLRHESPQNEPLPSASNTLWAMPKSLEPKRPAQLAIPTRFASATEMVTPDIPDRTPLSEVRTTIEESISVTPTSVLSWKTTENGTQNQRSNLAIENAPKPTPVVNSRRKETKKITHTVKEGETLQEISHTYFGTTRRWKDISDLNGMSNGNMVKVGQSLTLPGAESTVRPTAVKTQTSPEVQSYTVQKGDTLSRISQKTLGTTRRWREIRDLNKIKDSNSIKIGSVLNVPQK